MGNNTLSFEMQERIKDSYTVEDLVEALDLTIDDLLYYCSDKIVDCLDELIEGE